MAKYIYKAEYVDKGEKQSEGMQYPTVRSDKRLKRGDIVVTKTGKVRILFQM